jgi:hypothetical protein
MTRLNDASEVSKALTEGVCRSLELFSSALFSRTPDGGFIREASIGWEVGTAWHLLEDDPITKAARTTTKTGLRIDGVAWKDVSVPSGPARPLILMPIILRREVVALVLYAAHTNGADIDPNEARGLAELCTAAVFAFDQRVYASPGAGAAAMRILR